MPIYTETFDDADNILRSFDLWLERSCIFIKWQPTTQNMAERSYRIEARRYYRFRATWTRMQFSRFFSMREETSRAIDDALDCYKHIIDEYIRRIRTTEVSYLYTNGRALSIGYDLFNQLSDAGIDFYSHARSMQQLINYLHSKWGFYSPYRLGLSRSIRGYYLRARPGTYREYLANFRGSQTMHQRYPPREREERVWTLDER